MTSSIFGSAVRRVEDPRFLRGRARYVENVDVPGALRACFVRSMMAHARLSGVDLAPASAMPGVAGVFSGNELSLPPIPPSGSAASPELFAYPILADGVVRFVGQPIAVAVAGTQAQAEDAAEVVVVDYEPLGVAIGAEAALAEGAPLLFPEHRSNRADGFDRGWDQDVLAGAEVIVRGRFEHQRVAPVPMEANAVAAVPEGERMTLYVSTQVPFDVRNDVADALEMPRSDLRVIAPDVGGGFGTKLMIYPEYLAIAALARRLGRPVRWAESRSESMTSLVHGRAQVHRVELGAKRDGTLVGLRVELFADMGAYPLATYLPPTTRMMLSGVYRIPRIAARASSVVTNTTPIGPYRGAGRPEATATLERAMDLLAAELDMDPVELRRRNLIPAEAFPFETAIGTTYDVGDYERALDEALALAAYEDLRREQAERRTRGDRRQLGIGVSAYVEVTAFSGGELGSVEVGLDGSITVLTGISPHGQGHETSLAQLASGVLGLPLEAVRVIHSDTGVVPSGEGTFGSRSLQLGGSAVWDAANAVLDKARRIAAHLLEVGEPDVVLHDGGRIGVAGAPQAALSWSELATAAADPGRLPKGTEPGLSARGKFRQRGSTFPFGAHVALVEVDLDTGDARLLRHVALDDCGRILNPTLVEGQVHGGLAQGIAQALYEEVLYDELGTPMTSNLATYAMPSAAELPSFVTAHTETPTPLNPLGAKGIGESATIGSAPAVQSAVLDALAPLGVRHLDMPLSPERVWRAIREAEGRSS